MDKLTMAAMVAAVIGVGVVYMHIQTPRGIRNNNPLNIRVSRDNWKGAIGDDGEFVVFESPYYGLRAAARTLRTYSSAYGLSTIRGIVTRWAPPSENDTESYIRSVASQTGLDPDMNLLSASDYAAVMAAMVQHENGQQPFELALIKSAAVEGLYS